MKKYICIIISVLTLINQINSQTIQRNNFYVQNPYSQNPAYAGDLGNTMLFANYKQVLVGMPDAPRKYAIGGHGLISPKSGVGGMLVSNTHGVFVEVSGNIAYSHKLSFGDDIDFSVGMFAGFVNNSLNSEMINSKNLNDATVNEDNYQHAKFRTGMGVHFKWKNIYFDTSLPTLSRNDSGDMGDEVISLIGYKYKTLRNRIQIQPLMGYRYYKNYDDMLEYSVTTTLDERYWVTVGGRRDIELIFATGIYYNQIGIGYTYEYNNSELNLGSDGNHEVMFVYRFGYKKKRNLMFGSDKKF